MKKVSFQAIAEAVQRANIFDAAAVQDALDTARTVGRQPLITMLLEARRPRSAGHRRQ